MANSHTLVASLMTSDSMLEICLIFFLQPWVLVRCAALTLACATTRDLTPSNTIVTSLQHHNLDDDLGWCLWEALRATAYATLFSFETDKSCTSQFKDKTASAPTIALKTPLFSRISTWCAEFVWHPVIVALGARFRPLLLPICSPVKCWHRKEVHRSHQGLGGSVVFLPSFNPRT
jgi:hypothetical protein